LKTKYHYLTTPSYYFKEPFAEGLHGRDEMGTYPPGQHFAVPELEDEMGTYALPAPPPPHPSQHHGDPEAGGRMRCETTPRDYTLPTQSLHDDCTHGNRQAGRKERTHVRTHTYAPTGTGSKVTYMVSAVLLHHLEARGDADRELRDAGTMVEWCIWIYSDIHTIPRIILSYSNGMHVFLSKYT
jgi:hypothetical protein